MNSVLNPPNPSLWGGLAIAAIATALGFGTAAPAWAGYGFITIGNEASGQWQCEGNFQGNSGNGLCVPRESVDPGNPYDYYRGDVQNGTFSGRGKLVYTNDDRYEGQMRNGRPNGKGVFIMPEENRRYEGDFRNGEFHGRGVYTFGDGSRYVGQFAGGHPHGLGTLTANQNGKFAYTYVGRFYLGTINGNGSFTNAEGLRCRGVFYSNSLTGKGNCSYPSDSAFKAYTGEIRNGRPDGRGTLTYANGKTYTGEFREGQPGITKSDS